MEYSTNNAEEFKVENVSIEKIYKNDKNKDGQPYISSKGNPFTKVDIYIDARLVKDTDFEGKITFFDYYGQSVNWDIGSTITGTISKNGRYFNFQLPPSGKKALELDIKELIDRVEQLERQMVQLMKVKGQTQEVNEALDMSQEMLSEDKDEILDSDLPF